MKRTCTIIVLNHNGRDLLETCFPAVVSAATYGGARHQVVLLDNASSDGSAEFVEASFPQVSVVRTGHNGYLFSYNHVVRQCSTDYVLLLNNDVEPAPDCVYPLLRHFANPRVFAVMPSVRCEKPGGAYLNRRYGVFRRGFLHTSEDPCASPPFFTVFAHGGASAYDRIKFLHLGGFNPIYWPMYVEDNDLSYVAWMSGWLILFEPASQVYHRGAASTEKVFTRRGLKALQDRNNLLFVLKNVSDKAILGNCLPWHLSRLARSLVTLDGDQLRTYRDIALTLTAIRHQRVITQSIRTLSDRVILDVVRSNGIDGFP